MILTVQSSALDSCDPIPFQTSVMFGRRDCVRLGGSGLLFPAGGLSLQFVVQIQDGLRSKFEVLDLGVVFL